MFYMLNCICSIYFGLLRWTPWQSLWRIGEASRPGPGGAKKRARPKAQAAPQAATVPTEASVKTESSKPPKDTAKITTHASKFQPKSVNFKALAVGKEIKQLLNNDGQLYDYPEFIRTHNVTFTPEEYQIVVRAVPKGAILLLGEYNNTPKCNC